MSGKPDDSEEAARVRRRWLTLGEILGIAAVVISALTFWNSYSERRHAEPEQQADRDRSSRAAATLLLGATTEAGDRALALSSQAEGQSIESQTIRFPAALGLSPVETTGNARIERYWFATALIKARRASGMKEETGDARLPVLIESRFLADGDTHVDRAAYVIGYVVDSGFLAGTRIRLRGLSRIGAAKDVASGQRTIDAAWKAQAGTGAR